MDHFSKLAIDLFYSSGSANATRVSDTFPLKYPPPPAAITTNCLPVFLPAYVIGVAYALASRLATHNCSPVNASNPRKRLSVVAPMNTTPPAVTIEPPRLGVPVGIFRSSTIPNGTLHAISPLFTSTALSVPHGGFWHGHWCSSQNRAYSPSLDPRRYCCGAPAGCGSIAPTEPNSFAFTNKNPDAPSKEPPDQVAPPNVPGTTKVILRPYGVNIPCCSSE